MLRWLPMSKPHRAKRKSLSRADNIALGRVLVKQKPKTAGEPEIPSGSMESDAKTLAAKIYAGVNIGNTLEATGGETAWGNPRISEAYIKGLKALGFNAVRIPCAWNSHLSNETTESDRCQHG